MASGTESATETSYWIKFFTEAKIPAGDAAHYAVIFSDNRIQRGMLLDLNKEYLTDMGVGRLGDIIAILKHAKSVHDQDAKDKALKGAKYTSSSATSSPSPRRSTAASRMVGHFLEKTPDSGPMNQPPPPKPQASASNSKKSSVFDRLGSDSPGSGNGSKVPGVGDSVFSRLGGKSGQKRPASSTSPGDSDDDDVQMSPLQYQGIFKFTPPVAAKKPSPAMPRKKVRVTVEEPVKVTSQEKFKVTGLDRLSLSPKPSSFDMSDIQSFKVQVSSTTSTPKVKVKRRTTTVPVTNSLDDMLASAKVLSIQREEEDEEVTTTSKGGRSHGVLSMDAPTQSGSVKTRLGNKVQMAPASSTTSGFGPTTKISSGGDVRSRLGAKSKAEAAPATSRLSKAKTSVQTKVKASATSTPTAASGVFSRLGKKSAVS